MTVTPSARCIAVIAWSLATTVGAAELLLVDDAMIDADLKSASMSGLQFESTAVVQTLDWRELVRWGEPADPPRRPRVVLRDGSELIAGPPWTRDGSVQWSDDMLTLQSAVLLPLELPRAAVDHLLFEAARDPELVAQLSPLGDRDSDRLHLINGDVIEGRLASIGAGTLTLEVAGESIKIELGQAIAVELRPDQAVATPTASLVLGLADGSLLRCSSLIAGDRGVRAPLGVGVEARATKVSKIGFLQVLDGNATYLSDLEPLDYRHAPYAGVAWGYGQDANLDGGPLRVGGRRYLKGLAMHSPSRLVYRLTPGEHTRLDFVMAIDDLGRGDRPELGGSVVYRVLVAKQGGFEVAFTSATIRSGEPPRAASVDVAGARALALVVEPADFGDRLDYADWLDARLTP